MGKGWGRIFGVEGEGRWMGGEGGWAGKMFMVEGWNEGCPHGLLASANADADADAEVMC